MKISNIIICAGICGLLCSCRTLENAKEMSGTYQYDVDFFESQKIETLELAGENGQARVLIVPGYQARVMTSTASGGSGDSYGWINHKWIASGRLSPQFNPFGGEERFWLGPEGGKFSWYFEPGVEQVYSNWKVPALIDTEGFPLKERGPRSFTFGRKATLKNASGTEFQMEIERRISLLNQGQVEESLGLKLGAGLKAVAYQTENTLANRGDKAWSREGGLPSIWLLGMFNPSRTTTVFIPYNKEGSGRIVNDEYFGKVPADRLIVDEAEGIIYFKIDGEYRAKIGLPLGRALEICGSYDSAKKMLTLLRYTLPEGDVHYVNGQWGEQKDPFNGDVINSYNDGPTDDGTIMGPFYEVETSSPGAELKPGESLTHTQQVFHIQGEEAAIEPIVRKLLGVGLKSITERF